VAAGGAAPSSPPTALVVEAHLPLARANLARPLPFPLAFGYACDLVRAVAQLSDAGVVHGDVRPANLSLALLATPSATGATTEAPGRLLLGGFGRALRVDPRSAGAALALPLKAYALSPLGSAVPAEAAAYTAPEIVVAVRGSATAVPLAKADAWSAGVSLFEMLVGAHPFPGYPVSPAPSSDVAVDAVSGLGRILTAIAAGSFSASSSSSSSAAAASAARPSAAALAAPAVFPADYPGAFCDVLLGLLRPDPAQRLTARGAARRLVALGTGRPTAPLALPVGRYAAPPGTVSGLQGVALGPALSAASGAPLKGASSSSSSSDGKAADMEGDEKKDEEGDGVVMSTGTGSSVAGASAAAYVLVADGAATAAAAAASSPADSPGSLVPYGVVRFEASDADTAAVVIARAAELLDLPRASGNPSDLSLVCAAGRIDPLAPMHRLPASLRNGAAVLTLVPNLSAVAPDVKVHGFGVAAPPPPPIAPPQRSVGRGGGGQEYGGPGAASAAALAAAHAVGIMPGGGGSGAGAGSGGVAGGLASVAPATVGADRVVVFSFEPTGTHKFITLSERETVASTRGTWGTTLLAQGRVGTGPGQVPRYSFSVQVLALDQGAGVAIGFVDPARFDPQDTQFASQRGSWGYSRTGKISNGGDERWIDYGEPYGIGDVITAELIVSKEPRMRFWKNGIPQGIAFRGAELKQVPLTDATGAVTGLREITLVPAVCLGSNAGFQLARVQLKNPEVREFDREKAHHRIQFSEDCSCVWNAGKWATALAAHPGVRTGKLSWAVRLDDTRHGAGVAVGVVDIANFHWDKQNLGASPYSWCYSKTGKKGDGNGFFEYGKAFSNSDTITLTLDMDLCTLSFAVNGDDQGIAYDASSGIGSCTLVPAVCLGSTEGTKMAKVSILGPYPVFRRFNRFACNRKVALTDMYASAETSDKWGTVLVEHPGVRSGKFSFGVYIASAGQGCGAGVGFADADAFDPTTRNLGAATSSWCYSKTGKYSAGAGFDGYGALYKTGDTITAEVDMDAETFRFYLNGKDQGARKAEGIKNMTLLPAVVLGSSDGGHYSKLTLCVPSVTRYDPRRMNKHMTLKEDDRMAFTEGKWCSVLVDHPGSAAAGVLRFAVRLDGEGGAAIGFAEAASFKPYAQNLGASPNTWAISKTGKVSCGDADGFHPFSEKFGQNDVIGAEADMVEGIIRFWKNGNLLGTAFQGLNNLAQAQAQERGGRDKGDKGDKGLLCLVPAVCLGSNTGGKPSSALLVEFDMAWLR
jgi:hypothetical protein